jgi:hypothetical protein
MTLFILHPPLLFPLFWAVAFEQGLYTIARWLLKLQSPGIVRTKSKEVYTSWVSKKKSMALPQVARVANGATVSVFEP